MGAGYWEGWATPANVDWCEPNYVYTPYVAETWNTLSSFLLVLLGLYGTWRWWTGRDRLERRFLICFFGLILVGFGSAAFHGTLLRVPQALDELPMIWLGLVAGWMVWHRTTPRGGGRALAVGLLAFALGFTWAYTAAGGVFVLFLLTYFTLVTFITIRSVVLTWVRPAPRTMSQLLVVAAVGFLGTFFGAWIPEHVWLPCDHPLQAAQLHAWWHVGAGVGTYAWILWAVADRRRVEGDDVTVTRGFVEVVAPS